VIGRAQHGLCLFRGIFTAFNREPNERTTVKHKKLEKNLVKLGIGAVVSLMLGIIYKQGEKINEAIDEMYEREHGVKPS
jgi:hypothetical protein